MSNLNLSIIGSTGSIGTQALEIISKLRNIKVVALSCENNIELLKEQINIFKPEIVAVVNKEKADLLKEEVDIPVYSGENGLIKAATIGSSDTLLNSVVGSAGLVPTMEAIHRKKNIILANKETLVVAGRIVMSEVEKNKIKIIPVDSEHSAIFQCLVGESKEGVKRIILTGSGGPFRGKSLEELEGVTLKDTLNHPTWKMGQKVTVDSATLMNKGFEVIEARWLFDIPPEKIDVIIHPQSLIHSMVEFTDNSIKAQISLPDERIPISYALNFLAFDKRKPLNISAFDFKNLKFNMTFEKPDTKLFPCLAYAYESLNMGGSMPCIVNAADEVAVEHFLKEKIKFLDIPKLIKKIMNSYQNRIIKNPDIDDILETDKKVKEETREFLAKDLYTFL